MGRKKSKSNAKKSAAKSGSIDATADKASDDEVEESVASSEAPAPASAPAAAEKAPAPAPAPAAAEAPAPASPTPVVDSAVELAPASAPAAAVDDDAAAAAAAVEPPKPPSALEQSRAALSAEQYALAELLSNAGQSHLFAHWKPSPVDDEKKKSMMQQLEKLHTTYPLPGGLLAYCENARRLLAVSKEGKNPLEGWVPSVPAGASLALGTAEYDAYESAGAPLLGKAAFVLVAGGLGERLGYSGIKVGLPTEMCTSTSYLEYYCKTILAFQERHAEKGVALPLAIMVSDDTEKGTVALLSSNNNFGMAEGQITIMKQEKVAAISDNDGRIALDESDPFAIDSKPHGHGDVHSLLHSTGVAAKWNGSGFQYVVFFQDTNALGFLTLPAVIGVSEKLGLVMNSLAIPRQAKQAVGAICKLTNSSTNEVRTINVEYNQLDPLLRATINKDGDVNDPASGSSPFPGNINQLVLALPAYAAALKETSGIMGEFVNPKYSDDAKTTFKKPTRLETMMQDYPLVLSGAAALNCGFTSVPASLCFSPVKNAAADGCAAQAKGTPPGVAASGESDQYGAAATIMRASGCKVGEGAVRVWDGVKVCAGPKIVVSPSIAPSSLHFKSLFPSPSSVVISGSSCLVIVGEGEVVVESLTLDGALVIVAGPKGSKLVVKDAKVSNKGWEDVAVVDKSAPEVLRMRGYNLSKVETCTFEGSASGEYSVKADYPLPAVDASVSPAAADSVTPPPAPPAAPTPAASGTEEVVESSPSSPSGKKEAEKTAAEAGSPVRDGSVGHGASNDCGCSLM